VAHLRVLLADDELVARARLRRLLAAVPDVTVAGECDRGEALHEALRAGGADVVLLDVEMPGLSGLDALRLLPEPRPYVIFCTAHAEHAVAAFDVGAVDYVTKPVEAGRLAIAIERARRAASARSIGAPADAPRRLAIETREGVLLLDPAEITFAELDGALVTIHVGGRRVLSDLALGALEERLPSSFLRVHRRALLNLDHVTLLEPTATGGYVARTRGGHAVEVSRQAARELRRALGISRGG